jgi:hypothetical protein
MLLLLKYNILNNILSRNTNLSIKLHVANFDGSRAIGVELNPKGNFPLPAR